MLDSAAPRLAPLAGPEHAGRSPSSRAKRSPISRRGCPTRAPSCASCRIRRPRSAAAPAAGVANARGQRRRQRAWTERLMRAVGIFDWLADEALIDAVTALSGSGPGLCLRAGRSDGEGRRGRRPARATSRCALARATVEGAGELLHREPEVSRRPVARQRHLARRHHRRRARRVARARRPRRADDPRGRRGASPRGRTRGLSPPTPPPASPPSQVRTWPVTKSLAIRKAIALAMSSGAPTRPTGVRRGEVGESARGAALGVHEIPPRRVDHARRHGVDAQRAQLGGEHRRRPRRARR